MVSSSFCMLVVFRCRFLVFASGLRHIFIVLSSSVSPSSSAPVVVLVVSRRRRRSPRRRRRRRRRCRRRRHRRWPPCRLRIGAQINGIQISLSA